MEAAMNWTDFFIGFMVGSGGMYWALRLLILPHAIDKFIRDHDGVIFIEEFSDGSRYEVKIKKTHG